MTQGFPRATATIPGLQKTITAAVQEHSYACQTLVGVYIEFVPEHPSGSNWDVKGVKYGRAERDVCDEALGVIVRNLQDRYLVEQPRSFSPGVSEARNRAPLQKTFASLLKAAIRRVSRRP